MTYTVKTDKQAEKALHLLQQGYLAYNNWEMDKARLLWRKAAITDPSQESIWIALLNVTETDEDQIVCLQNILVLNPENEKAEARLRLLENDTQPADAQSDIDMNLDILRPDIRDRAWRFIGWVLTVIIVAMVGIIVFAILIQPFV